MFNSQIPTINELPSSQQLIRSTVIAVIIACALLVTVVMPAEYAIDPTGIGRALGLTQMAEIKIALAKEADADAVDKSVTTQPQQTMPTAAAQTTETTSVEKPKVVIRSDEMTLTLKPGEGSEIKMEMRNQAAVRYEWSATGPVNHDTHGEPYNGEKGYFHSYKKDKQVTGDQGEFTAIFDGTHGWFWRNRGTSDVTITIKVTGEYINIKHMI
jgi:hypothetical protein